MNHLLSGLNPTTQSGIQLVLSSSGELVAAAAEGSAHLPQHNMRPSVHVYTTGYKPFSHKTQQLLIFHYEDLGTFSKGWLLKQVII